MPLIYHRLPPLDGLVRHRLCLLPPHRHRHRPFTLHRLQIRRALRLHRLVPHLLHLPLLLHLIDPHDVRHLKLPEQCQSGADGGDYSSLGQLLRAVRTVHVERQLLRVSVQRKMDCLTH